jgi:hypothetical protein
MKSSVFDVPALDTSSIKPADEWRHRTTFGIMGFNDTPAGRLVRLADVLKWGMNNPVQRPYSAALIDFCSAIPNDAMEWLYQVNADYAKSIDSNHSFGYFTKEQLKKNKDKNLTNMSFNRIHRASGRNSNYPENLPTIDNDTPTEPGFPALMRKIGESWSKESTPDGRMMCDGEKLPINFLAIPFEKAHQHWGWGVLQEAPKSGPDDGIDPPPTKAHEKVKGTPWTPEWNAKLEAAYSNAKDATEREKFKSIAMHWGLSWQAVDKQLGVIKKTKNSALGRMVRLGSK